MLQMMIFKLLYCSHLKQKHTSVFQKLASGQNTTKLSDLLPEASRGKKAGPRKQPQKSTLRINRNLDSLINKEHPNESEGNESTSDLPDSVSIKQNTGDDQDDAKEDGSSTDASGVGDEEDDSGAEELMELLQMTKKSNELASKKQLF